jgi:Mrp family chromosome partitioning ATPase
MDNLAQLSKTPAPRTIPADQQKPATPSVSPSAPVASTVVKLPAAATRWSAPIHVAPPVQRVDAPHEINPPVHRPEALQTWAGQTVERSVKSTASFQSVPAKTVNPASMEANSVGPFSDDPFAAIAFETIVTSTINPPTHRLANGGFKPHFSQETPQPAAPESRRTPESTPSDIIDFQIPGVDARVKHSHFGNIATTNVPASTVRAPEASPLAANPSSTSNVFEKFNFRTGLSEQARNEASKPVVPIQPMWEVDSFFWPATVENLLSTQVEAFDEIGLHFQRMQSAGLRILSVTSGERGVGRSTVAMCLAKAVAKTGLKVALVDGDYETPSLIDQLNMAVDYGWQECISSNIPLDEVVVHSIEDGLALVPLTDSIAGSIVNEQLPRINKLIKRLSGAYDFVVIDGNRLTQKHPRLIGTGEEAVLDAALVIVDAELSLRQRVDTAVDLIREQGVKSIGLAENFHSEAIA